MSSALLFAAGRRHYIPIIGFNASPAKPTTNLLRVAKVYSMCAYVIQPATWRFWDGLIELSASKFDLILDGIRLALGGRTIDWFVCGDEENSDAGV